MNVREKKKCIRDLDKAQAQGFIDSAIRGIEQIDPRDWQSPLRVECRLHKMELSGPYGYVELEKTLGPLYVDSTFDPVAEDSKYGKKVIRNRPDFSLTIFVNPENAYLPRCRIRIRPEGGAANELYKQFLVELDRSLPLLNVSSVEYANDQFCEYPSQVESLFWIERRMLYVRYQRKMRMYGENLTEWGRTTALSAVFRIGNKKLYERGPDSKKIGDAWGYPDFDRVRLEHTARRTELRRHGVPTLKDFIRSPKFYDINKDIYRFSYFERSDKLPGIRGDYSSPDENGNTGAFQAELIYYRDKVENINQYIVDCQDFEPIKARLVEVWKEFDANWEDI